MNNQSMFWILLALTAPFFYLIGLVSFIGWILRSQKKPEAPLDRPKLLSLFIKELEKITPFYPKKTLVDQIKDYKKELQGSYQMVTATESEPAESIEDIPVSQPSQVEESPVPQPDFSSIWSNWYSDNSINLLLYIGAFLIVASASIYIGFQWETIGGVAKAILLTVLTGAFFGCGTMFYQHPKIKHAGATFLAIGAILIPFNGLAWYNFVLRDADYSFGAVWMVTSLVAIGVYAGLAYTVRHKMYTYIASVSGLSLLLALVNASQWQQEYYIIAGIATAFILLLLTRLFIKSSSELQSLYLVPLTLSAHIIMPLSLLFGLSVALSSNNVFSLESTIALLLASGYYATAYSFKKEIQYLAIALFLFPAAIFVLTQWKELFSLRIYLIIQVIGFGYYLASLYNPNVWKKESECLSYVAQALILGMFVIAIIPSSVNYSFPGELVWTGILATLFSFINRLYTRGELYAIIAEIVLSITVFLLCEWLGLSFLTICYVLQVVVLLYLTVPYVMREKGIPIFESTTVLVLMQAILLFLFVYNSEYQSLHVLLFALFPIGYSIGAAYLHKKDEYLYYGMGFFAVALYILSIDILQLNESYYVLGIAYLCCSGGYYVASTLFRQQQTRLQILLIGTIGNAALAIGFTAFKPVYFMITSLVYAGMLYDATLRYEKEELVYLSNVCIYAAAWAFLRSVEFSESWYAVIFSIVSYGIYAASLVVPAKLQQIYRNTGLLGSGISTFGLGLSSPIYSLSASYQEAKRNALVSAYLTSGLYAYHGYLYRKGFGYFASAVGMITYFWQMNYLGYTEMQVYTLPFGVYLLVLGYFQKLANKFENQQVLEYFGLAVLLLPLLGQSFGTSGTNYALIMAAEGLILFLIGNSFGYKRYMYGGITAIVLAVISQTYEFVFSLPRWIFTAVAGIIFLSVAIYLSLHRKDSTPK